MVSVCSFLGCSLIILTQFINIVFAFFPPLEELYRVLDSSPERLAVSFFYSMQLTSQQTMLDRSLIFNAAYMTYTLLAHFAVL